MERSILKPAPRREPQAGSVAVIALLSLVVISLAAAGVMRTVLPRFHVSHQTAGWQEARLAAEAGIDLALDRLNRNVPEVTASTADWNGWKVDDSTDATGMRLARENATALDSLVAPGNALVATEPTFLDNADVSPAVGAIAAADVQLQALYPVPLPEVQIPWFRIRSMGTAGLTGPARAASDRMDTSLRRLSLRGPMRPTLAANDVLAPTNVPFPNASRIVEVIARPVTPFSKAIVTERDMELGNSNGWQVNSYDSGDPNKSGPNGVYPGDDSAKIQSNGDIASNKKHASPTTYGALIDANGAEVLGAVSTNGGDNPATTTIHENVAGAGGIDPNRIDDDFDDPLTVKTVPTPASHRINPNYEAGVAFEASGSATTEYYYRIYGNQPTLGSFTVTGTGRITIIIDGNWDLGNGNGSFVTIPPGVQATIYVKGNIDFGNGMVNTTATSSKKPGNLIVYGVPDPNPDGSLPPRILNSNGNPEIAAAFYGPSYRVTLRGTAEWYGAVAAHSFAINGGGNGGFHYDEALGSVGFIRKFEIVSSFEDSRQ